jgi:hypothetical protein
MPLFHPYLVSETLAGGHRDVPIFCQMFVTNVFHSFSRVQLRFLPPNLESRRAAVGAQGVWTYSLPPVRASQLVGTVTRALVAYDRSSDSSMLSSRGF